jgi:ABC-type lipoprotein export system ATPase subunit
MVALCGLEAVGRSFLVHGQRLDVLSGVDLDIQEGERVSITGPSGAGKSTLLNIIGLVDDRFEGRYAFRGTDVRAVHADERARWRLTEIGIAFQDLHLVPSLTLAENVALPAVAAGVDETTGLARAVDLLEAAGLGTRTEHLPAALSGGERRRAAFARSLANRPRLLLLDEPTAELDAVSVEGILTLIRRAAEEGAAIVAVTHDPRLQELCRSEFAMHAGRLARLDAPRVHDKP